jgi:hypothetical protein
MFFEVVDQKTLLAVTNVVGSPFVIVVALGAIRYG